MTPTCERCRTPLGIGGQHGAGFCASATTDMLAADDRFAVETFREMYRLRSPLPEFATDGRIETRLLAIIDRLTGGSR